MQVLSLFPNINISQIKSSLSSPARHTLPWAISRIPQLGIFSHDIDTIIMSTECCHHSNIRLSCLLSPSCSFNIFFFTILYQCYYNYFTRAVYFVRSCKSCIPLNWGALNQCTLFKTFYLIRRLKCLEWKLVCYWLICNHKIMMTSMMFATQQSSGYKLHQRFPSHGSGCSAQWSTVASHAVWLA